jgi:hypothetical protein
MRSPAPYLLCLLFIGSAHARELEVDRLGSGPYKTLKSAAKAAEPGDVIRVKPGSGPYREILRIEKSGEPGKPIVFDGGRNLITAFEPMEGWVEKDGAVSHPLTKFPRVITYQGERLVQDFATGEFTKYADLNEAKDALTLRPGVGREGWEISKRDFAVEIKNVSHHLYRNVRASGSTNDGFNLHGTGSDLVFENIEGFHNKDEGFSSHDSIQVEIRGGKFWGNDNGIANSFKTMDVVSNVLKDIDVYDNLGRGLNLHDCVAVVENLRAWNNGVTQLRFAKTVVTGKNIVAYTPPFKTRPWTSYHDTRSAPAEAPATTICEVKESKMEGAEPVVKGEPRP